MRTKYDWRLSPLMLEKRDAAFSLLRSQVEGFVRANCQRVVLVGHSMGNKFIHYFLCWAEKTLGRRWIDTHVRLFVAMGAPWTGAAKTLRSVHVGDAMGLEMLLSYTQTAAFCRSHADLPALCADDPIASLGWLMPCDEEIWKRAGLQSSMYVSSGHRASKPIPREKMLELCPKFDKLERTYQQDPLYGGVQKGCTEATVLGPPPVQELLCIYGKNLPTEVGIMFRKQRKPQSCYGEEIVLKLDTSKKRAKAVVGGKPGVRAKGGLLLEVPWEGSDGLVPSGDGTVPYASLTHYKKWIDQPGAPRIRSLVFDGAEHRGMLAMPEVIGALLHRLAIL